MSFVKDSKIQEEASLNADGAIKFALDHYRIDLDWSDDSIEKIELILSSLHKEARKDKPTQEQMLGFAIPFGSYIGEVYRRNHGAEWGSITLEGETYPGLQCSKRGQNFWPWLKALKRIENGDEDNVWHYYQILLYDKVHKW